LFCKTDINLGHIFRLHFIGAMLLLSGLVLGVNALIVAVTACGLAGCN
jgi:hypothetical protein